MNDPISYIAERLAENALKGSAGLPRDRSPISIQGRKVVALVGAGASHAVGGLPLGKELAAWLIAMLKCDEGDGRTAFEGWLKYMEARYGFDREDFKTILFSLHQMKGDELVRLVQDSLNAAHVEQSAYDHLAAFLAQGQLDAIVNFNFDEILDTAISKVMPEITDYWRVYSEASCSACFSYDENIAIDKPLYIKPHGTISNGSTLRFARKDYYQIEPLQRALIEHLFGTEPVIIVVIGFRLKFFEFSQLLARVLVDGSEIVIVDKHEDVLDASLLKYYKGAFLQVDEATPFEHIFDRLRSETEFHKQQNELSPKSIKGRNTFQDYRTQLL